MNERERFEARRRAIADGMARIQRDADRWNRTHPDEEPIVIDADLTADVATLRAAKENAP